MLAVHDLDIPIVISPSLVDSCTRKNRVVCAKEFHPSHRCVNLLNNKIADCVERKYLTKLISSHNCNFTKLHFDVSQRRKKRKKWRTSKNIQKKQIKLL